MSCRSAIWCCYWYTVPPGLTIYLPPGLVPQLGEVQKINEISMHVQYTQKSSKWCLKTSKSVQNEVPRGTWSHQNHEKVEKVKSHENISIYYTFERSDHQKSQDFPIKINQNSCMQSKQAFVHFKSQTIWKSNPKWSPERDPKSIKNHEKSILGPSRAPLCASLLNLITRMLPKDPHMTENGHLVTLILGSTPKLSGAVLFEDPFAGWGLAGQHFEGSIKLNCCKPCISSNPSLTSGCNHKGRRRQGRKP